jgi:adenylylsulfate kinase
MSTNGKGCILWFTGLSGAGKSTLAEFVAPLLRDFGLKVEVLDGDEVRENLSKGLGFSKEDRDTNIRRIGFVANLLARNGVIAITAAISPYRPIRDEIRSKSHAPFVEIFVNAPLATVEERDTKGLYRKARAGVLKQFTGVSDPYEEPSETTSIVPGSPARRQSRSSNASGYCSREKKYVRRCPLPSDESMYMWSSSKALRVIASP